ncbi:hypothetical protein PZT57_26815 [Pseudomonas aeruginosa]|uniref:hypothetical protein n=1 Tax=Pseudomonas aeruginosa TaxID=287 RepID=UPI002B27B425|nr:hypothetical protein [Pseudomonas aeruginosa]MEA8592263.1 hypothetical protein [Pseudomonas aeruginosa]
MFGSNIPSANPNGMAVSINDIPAGTLSAEQWNQLASKVRGDKWLMLRQVWSILMATLNMAMEAIGAGLGVFGAFLVFAIFVEPEAINTAITGGFATKVQFVLSLIAAATVLTFFVALCTSPKMRRDPVEDEMWRLVRVALGVHATGNYSVRPAIVEVDAPAGAALGAH